MTQVKGCDPLPDQTAVSSTNAWTDRFANIQYSLKVQAILSEIDGLNHEGTAAKPVPNVFGMNFHAVSVGEKLIENSTNQTGGYEDGVGTPTPPLLNEIIFFDNAICKFVAELKETGALPDNRDHHYRETWSNRRSIRTGFCAFRRTIPRTSPLQ